MKGLGLNDPPGVVGNFICSAHGCTAVAIGAVAALQLEAIGSQGDLGLVAYYRQPINVQASSISGIATHAGTVVQVFPSIDDRDALYATAKASLAQLVERIDLATRAVAFDIPADGAAVDEPTESHDDHKPGGNQP